MNDGLAYQIVKLTFAHLQAKVQWKKENSWVQFADGFKPISGAIGEVSPNMSFQN